MATISVNVTCSRPNWVTIDDLDVPLHNGKTAVALEPGSHTLVWALIGSPGDKFEAELKNRAASICKVSWSIPAGSSGWTGDFKPFTV